MNKPRPGRPRALSAKELREIVRQVVKSPFASAPTLSSHIAPLSGKIVCAQTVRNVFHSTQFLAGTPRKKPFINEINRQKRLKFAKTYVDKPMEFSKKGYFLR